MTKRLPKAREVGRSLHGVESAVKGALKDLNRLAGEEMTKGRYESAEKLVTKGREMQEFLAAVRALGIRWQELRGSTRTGAQKGERNDSKTPLWSYYQPVLQALSAAGGEARRTDLEAEVERLMADSFLPADRETMARDRERWQVMIQRTRTHLVAEGWIEDRSGARWIITEAGRRAALSSTPPGPGE